MSFKFRQFSSDILQKEKLLFQIKKTAPISSVLVFPNYYKVGINNLGFQTVHRLLNENQYTYAERGFLYQKPFESIASSLESNRPISNFDLLAFSISFELDYINIAKILTISKIPLYAKDRGKSYPLVIAGGMPMFMNPMPAAPFFDVIFLGEAETLLNPFLEVLENGRLEGWNRKMILEQLVKIDGLFIPSYHLQRSGLKIKYSYAKKTDYSINASSLMTSQGTFKDMYLLEVGRGCRKKCRFCAAGNVYQPYRTHQVDKLIKSIDTKKHNFQRIGFIGSAISDYPDLPNLLKYSVDNDLKLGISSFRVDELTPENIEYFEKGGLKSIAIAPESGSDRLRKVINKKISETEIIEGVKLIAHSSITNLKLYFMIGLPFEEFSDIEAIVNIGSKINQIFNEKSSKGSVKVSCNVFIPKAFTPFQWMKMDTEEELNKKRDYLIKSFKKFNKMKFDISKSNQKSLLQGILSLGGLETSKLIEKLSESDKNWKYVAKEIFLDYSKIILRNKQFEEQLPWDFINRSTTKKYLWNELLRAKEIANYNNDVDVA